MSILSLNEKDWTSAMSFASLWHYYGEFLIGIIVGNVVFMLILLIGFEKFINASAAGLGCKHIVLAILVSSYFKIFLVAMMVWEFPSSVVFMIDMFILSSNTVALKGEWGSLHDMIVEIEVGATFTCIEFCPVMSFAYLLFLSERCIKFLSLFSTIQCVELFSPNQPVLGNAAAIRCFGVSFAAYAVKFLTCQWLRRLL